MKLGEIYTDLEHFIAPSWPLLVALGVALIAITAYLIWRGNPALLAGWLVYMFMP